MRRNQLSLIIDSASIYFLHPEEAWVVLAPGVVLLLVAGVAEAYILRWSEHCSAYFPLWLVVAISFFYQYPRGIRGYASFALLTTGTRWLHIRWG